MIITSLDNKKVKEWTKLHNKKYRDEEYLLLNEELVLQAFKKKYLKTLIYVKEMPFDFSQAYEVTKEVMLKITKGKDIDYIGVGLPIKEKIDYGKRVIILEDLQDPLNIGRIIESATLFGFDQVILSENAADLYNPKCLEAAGKSFFNVNIARKNVYETIIELKNAGFMVYATGLRDNTKEMYEIEPNEKMAFILGNEGSGVKQGTFEVSDEVVKIDMNNIDSLNVAMAGAIIMYHFSK